MDCDPLKLYNTLIWVILILLTIECKVCWGQNFHATWLYFIGNLHHINILWILGKYILKPKRAHIYTKWCQSPQSKTHGNIISSKPMVQAHGTTSHLWLMIQAYESHQGNFGNRGLEGQEVYSVKLQRFKVIKRNTLLGMSFPIPWTLTSQYPICNIW